MRTMTINHENHQRPALDRVALRSPLWPGIRLRVALDLRGLPPHFQHATDHAGPAQDLLQVPRKAPSLSFQARLWQRRAEDALDEFGAFEIQRQEWIRALIAAAPDPSPLRELAGDQEMSPELNMLIRALSMETTRSGAQELEKITSESLIIANGAADMTWSPLGENLAQLRRVMQALQLWKLGPERRKKLRGLVTGAPTGAPILFQGRDKQERELTLELAALLGCAPPDPTGIQNFRLWLAALYGQRRAARLSSDDERRLREHWQAPDRQRLTAERRLLREEILNDSRITTVLMALHRSGYPVALDPQIDPRALLGSEWPLGSNRPSMIRAALKGLGQGPGPRKDRPLEHWLINLAPLQRDWPERQQDPAALDGQWVRLSGDAQFTNTSKQWELGGTWTGASRTTWLNMLAQQRPWRQTAPWEAGLLERRLPEGPEQPSPARPDALTWRAT